MVHESAIGVAQTAEPNRVAIAQFLTVFQNQYRVPNSKRHLSTHVITWHSVERALRARELIELEGERVDKLIRSGVLDVSTSSKKQQYSAIAIRNRIVEKMAQDELLRMVVTKDDEQLLYPNQRASIRNVRQDILYMMKLIDAFEIWSTIALCSEVFRPPPSGGYNALHVPIKWPKTPISNPDCFNQLGSHGVCPNSLSYREFARLAVVAASHAIYSDIEIDDDNSLDSNMDYTSSHVENQTNSKENDYAKNNTSIKKAVQAELMGLWLRSQRSPLSQRQLFHSFRIEKINETSIESRSNKTFRTKFLGKITPRSSDKDAVIVDNFIQTMISNALLVQYSDLSYDHQGLFTKRNFTSSTSSKSPMKRQKACSILDEKKSKRELDSQFIAGLQNLFRWFSFRNASPTLCKIFCNDIEPNSEHCALDLKERSLIRIDTRIQQKNYSSLDDLKTTILKLLDVFIESVPPCDIPIVQDAMRDLDILFDSFYLEHAKSLSLPFLHSETCAKCAQSLKSSRCDLKTCACCFKKYHLNCEKKGSSATQTFFNNKSLFEIYALDPSSLDDESVWETLTRDIERSQEQSEWGMSLEITEEYCEAMQKLKAGLWHPIVCKKNIIPIPINSTGLVVSKVRLGSLAHELGVMEGDVITRVDVIDDEVVSHEVDREKSMPSINLSSLRLRTDRIEVFKKPYRRLRLYIERSSPNLMEVISNWIKTSLENAPLLGDNDDDNPFSSTWYCSACYENRVEQPPSIALDAKRCQAIIRHLGFHWYSLPYHDDVGTLNGSNTHCGLKRLDGMMTSIIEKKYLSLNENPFYYETKSESDECSHKRLSWASEELENDPLKLLCVGMNILLNHNLSKISEQKLLKRKIMGTEFLKLVLSNSTETRDGLRVYMPTEKYGVPWLNITTIPESPIPSKDALQSKILDDIKSENIDAMHTRRCISLVGSTILFVCDDKRMKALVSQRKTQQNYYEYVVATFTPKSISKTCNDTFCVVPISKIYDLQEKPLNVGSTYIEEVEGMITLSFDEVLESIDDSRRMKRSVDETVLQLLMNRNTSTSKELHGQCSNLISTFVDTVAMDWICPSNIESKLNLKINEFSLIVDMLCSIQSYIVRDTLEDINKLRDGQRPSQQQVSLRPQQYAHCPELDTDIGESDDDLDDIYESDEEMNDSKVNDESQHSSTLAPSGSINQSNFDVNLIDSEHDCSQHESPAVTTHVNQIASSNEVQDVYLKVEHLYTCGLPGSLLSWAETVVLIEAMLRNQPVLGIRLLCPRYDIPYIQSQYTNVIEPYIDANLNVCPRLHDDQWKAIIVADYQRSLLEAGPVIFKEGGYSYRSPFQVLPLDRLLENWFATSTTNLFTQVGKLQPIENLPQLQNFETTTVQTNTANKSVSQQVMIDENASAEVPRTEKASSKESIVDLTEEEGNNNPIYKIGPSKVERIRGGAYREDSLLLSSYPVDSWVGLGVYGKCMTTFQDNSDAGEDVFLGKVERVLLESDSCEVSIIYVMKTGYLPMPMITIIPHEQLRVVQSVADKRILAQSSNSVSVENIHINMSIDENMESNTQITQNMSSSNVPNYAKTKYGIYKTRNDISLDRAAKLLIDRLNHRMTSCAPLGILPDGNFVCWFQSDPRAIYIRLRNVSESEFRQSQHKFRADILKWSKGNSIIAPPAEGKLCCPWGCSNHGSSDRGQYEKRTLISFDSRDELENHMKQFHVAFGQSRQSDSKWIRIAEGEGIRSVCADLTAACCVVSLELSRVAIKFVSKETSSSSTGFSLSPFLERMIFKHSAILDLTQAGRGSIHFSNLLFLLPNTDLSLRQYLRLWSRLCRLFSVEAKGYFRLSSFHCVTKIENGLSVDNGRSKVGNIMDVDVAIVGEDQISGEEDIESVDVDDDVEEELLSDTDEVDYYRKFDLISNSNGQEENANLDSSLTTMAALKDLLLRLALLIPPELKLDSMFWEQRYFNRWSMFLEKSDDERFLYQSLVLLQSSLKQACLAKWFCRGWYSSYGVLSNITSLANFAFRLFLLDSAVADYIKTLKDVSDATVTDSEREGYESKEPLNHENVSQKNKIKTYQESPTTNRPRLLNVEEMLGDLDDSEVNNAVNKLMKKSLKLRIETISKLATKYKIRRFEGKSCDNCLVCSLGGDLLCCEFCNQVQHMECCNPPMKNMTDFDYVCADCIHDIVVTDMHATKFPR